jgi:hypothetical protein
MSHFLTPPHVETVYVFIVGRQVELEILTNGLLMRLGQRNNIVLHAIHYTKRYLETRKVSGYVICPC